MSGNALAIPSWLVGAIGVVVVAVILSLIEADVALWDDDHQQTTRDEP